MEGDIVRSKCSSVGMFIQGGYRFFTVHGEPWICFGNNEISMNCLVGSSSWNIVSLTHDFEIFGSPMEE